jgi:hypothetical protein
MRSSIVVVFIVLIYGCAPHYYNGEMALLELDENIEVILSQSEVGDCYRRFGSLPTVYRIERLEYTLLIAHGNRYWPEFFFSARSVNGEQLELTGNLIEPVPDRWRAYRSKVEEQRQLELTHQTGRGEKMKQLNQESSPIVVTIRNSEGQILGREPLRFTINKVDCFAWDAV